MKKMIKQSAIAQAIPRRTVLDRYLGMQSKAEGYSTRALERSDYMNSNWYAGVDPRRRQEVADAGLIREDKNAMANLPTMAQHHEYPGVSYYDNCYIDSAISWRD